MQSTTLVRSSAIAFVGVLALAFIQRDAAIRNTPHASPAAAIDRTPPLPPATSLTATVQTETPPPPALGPTDRSRHMVRIPADADPATVASDLGAELDAFVSRASLAVLSWPDDARATDALASSGHTAWEVATIRGADDALDAAVGASTWQGHDAGDEPERWHIDAARLPSDDVSSVRVAVLDTGTRYFTSFDESDTLPSDLAWVSVVDPVDLVNGDDRPLDDHGHGTHVAALIVGRDYRTPGAASGARIMPIKVLGDDKTGDESTLILGLYHALDHGADVVNLSLTFSEGYVPSEPLIEAIAAIHDAGIVMVAAAGNHGGEVLWPAASPHILAIGAASPTESGDLAITEYSARGPELDMLAPGGRLDADMDGDGYADGIIASSYDPVAETQTVSMMAGTSQAAALVSGAAARLLAEGARPEDVPHLLQSSAAEGGWAHGPTSADHLDITESVHELHATYGTEEVCSRVFWTTHCRDEVITLDHAALARELGGSVFPWLEKDRATGQVRLAAMATLVEDGVAVEGADLVVHVTGSTDETLHCITDGTGSCVVRGSDWVQPEAREQGWLATLSSAVVAGLTHRPAPALFDDGSLTPGLDQLDEVASLDDASLSFHLSEGEDNVFGPVAEAYSLLSTSDAPSGLVLTPLTYDNWHVATEASVGVDGSGFATSPIGAFRRDILAWPSRSLGEVTLVVVDGSGFATSPVGQFVGTFRPTSTSVSLTSTPDSTMGSLFNVAPLSTGEVVGAAVEMASLE